MTFVIRRISTSAAGREIIRTSEVEGDVVAIGRDPGNDIVLTDLSIAPHHARLTRTGEDGVMVEALTDFPLRVDSARTQSRDIAVARGATIGVGDYRILVSAGETPGTIAIEVREAGEQTEDSDTLARRFSLAASAPGKRAMAWVSVLAVLAVFLAWPILSFYQQADARITDAQYRARATGTTPVAFTADQSWSPGPLSKAHHQLEGDCKACHVGAFVSLQDETCATCHRDAHDHARPDRLLAAMEKPLGFSKVKQDISTAFGRPPGRCVDCHNEHLGPEAMQPVGQAFCADCHGALKDKLPDTKLANAGDFSTQHPQLQPLVMTTPGARPRFTRMSMASRPQEDIGLVFPHDIHVSQTGAVARMQVSQGQGLPECADCHVPDRSGVRFKPVDMETSCQSCHSLAWDSVGGRVRNLPHGDVEGVAQTIRAFSGRGSGFVPGMRRRPGVPEGAGYGPAMFNSASAVRATFQPGGQCYGCHVIQRASNSVGFDVVPVRQPLRYLAHGWFDHSAHKDSACTDCHNAETSASAKDLMLPTLANCQSCHVGEGHPLKTLAGGRKQVESNCSMCHSYHQQVGQPPRDGPDFITRTATRTKSRDMGGRPLEVAWSR